MEKFTFSSGDVFLSQPQGPSEMHSLNITKSENEYDGSVTEYKLWQLPNINHNVMTLNSCLPFQSPGQTFVTNIVNSEKYRSIINNNVYLCNHGEQSTLMLVIVITNANV